MQHVKPICEYTWNIIISLKMLRLSKSRELMQVFCGTVSMDIECSSPFWMSQFHKRMVPDTQIPKQLLIYVRNFMSIIQFFLHIRLFLNLNLVLWYCLYSFDLSSRSNAISRKSLVYQSFVHSWPRNTSKISPSFNNSPWCWMISVYLFTQYRTIH